MGTKVRCPGPVLGDGDCGSVFWVHGYERWTTCDDCGRGFNPQNHQALDLL